jgi:shikimate kinase
MCHILLTGFKGCGKTTVGRLLAERTNRAFVDLDSVLEDIHARENGERLGFRDIFVKLGAEAFRELELRAAVETAEMAKFSSPMVIALGGGALLRDETRAALRPVGTVVCLRVSELELLQRARRGGFPAYIRSDKPEEEFLEEYRRRDPLYRQHSDLVVELGRESPQRAAERVIEELNRKKGEMA